MSVMGPMMTYLTPLYDVLIRRTADGSLVPAVATKWEYTDADSLHLQLSIRDGVVFDDGSALDAAAVKKNIEDARDTKGPFSNGLAAVQSVDVGQGTVTLNLSERVPNLENTLAGPAGMLVQPSALGTDTLASKPAGSGAYVLDPTSVAGSTYVLSARDGYWDQAAYGPKTLNLLVLSDTDARLNALVSGQVDATVAFVQQAETAKAAGLSIVSNPLNFYAIGLLDRSGTMVPALADKRVRQALNFAVDRDAVVAALTFGYGEPSTQMFDSESPAFSKAANDFYTYDPDKAKALLKEAGFGDGLTIPVFAEARFGPYLEAVDGFLRAVGVTLDITLADSGQIAAWSSGKYPAPLVTFGSNDPLSMIQTWALPDSPNNPFHTELPGIDDMTAKISAAKSPEELNAAYQQVSEAVTEEGWFLTTHILDTLYAFNPAKVDGIEAYSGNSVPYVYGWTVKS
jgi:peptide/nickel transport system substrate-binding protein